MFPVGVNSFSELFSGTSLIVKIVLAAANGVLLFFASQKFLLALQQSGYRYKRYFKWLANKNTPYLSRLMLLCLLGFLFFCVLNTTFSPIIGDDEITSYIGMTSYTLFTLLYIKSESTVNAKVPLKKTKRLVRLSVTYALLLTAASYGLLVLLDYVAYVIGDEMLGMLRYSLICGMPILTPYLLFIAYCVNEPLETLLRRYHVKSATAKLDAANVIKIGITGSYAKTSVKEILKTILSQKFRVLATPESYNTPLGISISLKSLDSTHDVFIAEMGARERGDIKTLAKMVKPKYGVLTGINNQHMETFGSKEAIAETKYELFENLSDGGAGFFSSDSSVSAELYDKFEGEKYLAGINGDAFVTAKDVVTNEHGTEFSLCVGDETPVRCNTVLLGRHNVGNICLAASVAYKIGLSATEIAEGINRIKSVEHRLELMPNNKGIVVIDDSYNSNEDGVRAAMEVLDTFDGRKIVLTPGLVELGKEENAANYNFGKLLAQHADRVIVIGKHNAEMLIKGLIDGGMPRENVSFEKSVTRGNKALNETVTRGDVVLFENDLPDNYN